MTRSPVTRMPGLVAAVLVLFFTAASVSAASKPDSETTRLDFEIGPRGHIILPVSVNGGEAATFAVDTGASMNVINSRYADEIDLDLSNSGSFVAHGAHKNSTVRPTTLESIKVGPLFFGDVDAVVMDLSHVERPNSKMDGILGVPFLQQYDVRIDFEQRVLELAPPSGKQDGVAASFRSAHGSLIYLDVVIDDQPITALLDTGSGRSAINLAAARAMGLEVPAAPDADGHGAWGNIHEPQAGIADVTVEVGEAELTTDAHVGIVDLPVFASLGVHEQPMMLLGTNFLRDRTIGIDYQNNMFYVDD